MNFNNKKFLAKGYRSNVYIAKLKGKYIVIKKRKKNIAVNQHIKNEGRILKILNKYKIGPKLISYDEDKIVMEFVKGDRILDWLKKNKNDKIKVRKMISELIRQCRVMDKLKIEKKEMHKPFKHIIIDKKLVMIDFERARKRRNAMNVTQVCEFLARNNLMKRDARLLRKYKHDQTERNFDNLKKLIY